MTEKNLYPSDQADKVLVRMPDGMRDRLKEVAKSNNRTLNAEIVARLERSFTADKDVEEIAFENGSEASMLREEVALLTELLQQSQADRLLSRSVTGNIAIHSVLSDLAGQLHDLQGKRNTLALVAHALKQSTSDAEQLEHVRNEIALIDEAIAKVLTSIQENKRTD